MRILPTDLPGVMILEPRRIRDSRGFFCETWNAEALAGAGIGIGFVQDNQSVSERAGTLRGLHLQAPPAAQAKLVRCGRGRILDVAVDVRRGSPGFGRWTAVELSAENGRQLLIPEGFLHGFVTREPDTEVLYKCSAPYRPETERAVRWDDPGLGIDWGLGGSAPLLGRRDAEAPGFAALGPVFTWQG